jgi:HEXXH motif-containing protein
MAELEEIVHKYLEAPYPLWEYPVTKKLVESKRENLEKKQGISFEDYTTPKVLCGNINELELRTPLINIQNEIIYAEAASFDSLKSFYAEHGLVPCCKNEFEVNLSNLKKALAIFDLVSEAKYCIGKLVRSIQILKQDDPEIDVSYSHPKIPFSIFVSICNDDSTISNLRVAESILHETMHLKLTLIENIIPLVIPFSANLYYSPWRDEGRPAQGILHGLFVFKAVKEFYLEIIDKFKDRNIVNFLEYRIEDIRKEIESLSDFKNNVDLTIYGKTLAFALLNIRPS